VNDALEERCAEVTAEAEALRQLGRNAEALRHFTDALEITAQLAEADPADHRPVQQRASILYSLGALHVAAGREKAAITVLDQCEEIYTDLGARGVVDAGHLIADVKARRGRAKMALGHGASAALALDEAVRFYRELFTEDDCDEHALDLARVLTLNAEVLFVCGDPDVAVASADHALRLYLHRADAANNDPRGPAAHSGYFRQAATIAAHIHAVHGRLDAAVAADELIIHALHQAAGPGGPAAGRRWLAAAFARMGLHLRAAGQRGSRRAAASCLAESSALDAGAAREQEAEWERMRAEGLPVTLAEALDAAATTLGRSRVREELREVVTAPATEGRIISPSGRCHPELAPAWGSELADIAVDMLPMAPREGLRIGLEAHLLFAIGSRVDPPYLRYQFDKFGVPWARLLLGCCRSLAAMADQRWALPMALDLAGWNLGVINNLLPWVIFSAGATAGSPGRLPPGPRAVADGVNVAELARDCLTQHAELHDADGDHEAARQLREMAASIGRAN
jgi:tetratricopeptide (TPR) repeat protein